MERRIRRKKDASKRGFENRLGSAEIPYEQFGQSAVDACLHAPENDVRRDVEEDGTVVTDVSLAASTAKLTVVRGFGD